ncbi:DUF6958 family protein [Microbulbifer spongiae]|uniref:DUF3253 domain-containing protein n=1 Tax=Microbulbifer spongiae TaxID=2944933 RepID=A0ABY9EE98_9GAMM|nr:hypothetical protein [Microbulbifer sp. MI-G]WKD49685.1 hypothetical protein M8T91_17620 [Microbulbifer sp. MI-G]
MTLANEKIEIENIHTPGRTERVNKVKYMTMRAALLPVLPTEGPGITIADAKKRLLENLSQAVFPGGEKAGWWLKAVQLDLEAKGIIARGSVRPVRIYRVQN